jgi:hypothetical protein
MSSHASLLFGRHEHHHTAEQIDTALPRGNLIFVHAGLQALAWGLVFPIGMALGLKKSRWHVPVQVAGLCMTGTGYILGASSLSCHEAARLRDRWERVSGRVDLAASVEPTGGILGGLVPELTNRPFLPLPVAIGHHHGGEREYAAAVSAPATVCSSMGSSR